MQRRLKLEMLKSSSSNKCEVILFFPLSTIKLTYFTLTHTVSYQARTIQFSLSSPKDLDSNLTENTPQQNNAKGISLSFGCIYTQKEMTPIDHILCG